MCTNYTFPSYVCPDRKLLVSNLVYRCYSKTFSLGSVAKLLVNNHPIIISFNKKKSKMTIQWNYYLVNNAKALLWPKLSGCACVQDAMNLE